MSALLALLPKLGVFLVTTVVGATAASVAVTAMKDTTPTSSAGLAPEFLLVSAPDTPNGEGVAVAFDAEPGASPEVLPTLSPDDLALAAESLLGDVAPASFVNPSEFPRIPPITQFDGGPFAGSNCTLTSGAMLIRLTHGVPTSGSFLRTQQDDQDGGTDLNDLATALWRAYGISLPKGLIRPSYLKDLLASGHGAVVQGDYSKIPPGLRLQKSFTGGHAIYIDGYYPGNPRKGIPEAYYVIDPIGRPHAYQGDWWPASIVDAFATTFGGGRIAAMWGYPPGGVPPQVDAPDVVPIPPSGGGGSSATPAPGATLAPGATATPLPSVGPLEPGDVGPVFPAPDTPIDGPVHVGDIVAIPALAYCLVDPPPADCPGGIEAVFDLPIPPIIAFPLGPKVNVLFVDSNESNVAMVGYTVDPATTSTVKFWEADGSPATVRTPSSSSSITLFGKIVRLARLDVLASTTYRFQAVAGSGLYAGQSAIGEFTTGDGVEQFDVALSTAANPKIELATGLSPYLHLAPDAYAFPMLKLDALGGSTCLSSAVFGGTAYCTDLEVVPVPDVCHRAEVAYALAGIDADTVLVRAYPADKGVTPDGDVTLDGVLEAEGPVPSGDVSVGCLASGLTYNIVLDAVGDDRGALAVEAVTVP